MTVVGQSTDQTPATVLVAQVAAHGVWTNTYQSTPPVYDVHANTPVVVQAIYPNPWNDGLAAMLSAVPVPTYFQPDGATDGEAVIIDHTNNATYDLYKCVYGVRSHDGSTGWTVEWGGGAPNTTFNDYQQYGRTWAQPGGINYGVEASGFAFTPGVIRWQDLSNGRIPYAVQLIVPWSDQSWKYPATRTDGGAYNNPAGSTIQYGQMYRLDPGLDISGLQSYPRMVAQAAKDYGLIATDETAGGTVTFRCENRIRQYGPWGNDTNTTVDPYRGPGGLFGYDPDNIYANYPDQNNLFRSFPWSSLVAVDWVPVYAAWRPTGVNASPSPGRTGDTTATLASGRATGTVITGTSQRG